MGKRIISWASPLPQTLQRTLVPGAAVRVEGSSLLLAKSRGVKSAVG
jgi:hypothetical protein